MYDAISKLPTFRKLCSALAGPREVVTAAGCVGSQKISLAARLAVDFTRILFVFPDEEEALSASRELSSLIESALVYPARDLLFHTGHTGGKYVEERRAAVLRALTDSEGGIVCAGIDALLDMISSAEELVQSRLTLRAGMLIDPGELAERLTAMGYERVFNVETAGEFAVRGGIADIYPLTADAPCRLEFFGDEIESLRLFNTFTQRTTIHIEETEVLPVGTAASRGRRPESSLADYYGAEDLIILDQPKRLFEKARELGEELAESTARREEKGIDTEKIPVFTLEELFERLLCGRCLLIARHDEDLSDFGSAACFRFKAASAANYKESFSLLVSDLMKYQREGYRVTLMTPSRTRASRLAEDFRSYGIRAYCPDTKGSTGRADELRQGDTEVVTGGLKQGFIYPEIRYALLTENDMFGRSLAKRRRRKYGGGVRIDSLGELRNGDYVVHENHGIGVYRGIEHIVREEVGRDYLKIEYAGGSNLYVPVTKLELIQKYGSAEGREPKLSRLNSPEWSRTRARVARSAKDMAIELVRLYAARLSTPGYRYSPDTVWQREFEEMFPFEETEDQTEAIAAVKRDMESGRITDRLICGDVGYGKTEIAMRAAFKAVQDGKQVAMLVPTTILADQHYRTFTERFEKFPVHIAVLSRFRSDEEVKKTLDGLRKGSVDIVIGTHRLLSGDVVFKDLGLFIVDEEQRFGVAHKEKIKELKKDVEALSLTATPIPRTLHMSLAGIRDISLLNEPPYDRVPTETYVFAYDEEYVREAAARELARGGQVFYVYNRVRNIEEKAIKLRALLPDARIEYAHGQMRERELEDIMADFVAGRIDILVSTTIIESGLDIQNANTLIVDGAESMGLSQLYQLRGRVGRSGRTAYAFFLYRKDRLLAEEADRRLGAIREFTGFGSGIKIAMRDLEIRGAGNVLGAEQHGDMQAVGYELYLKILSRAVSKEKGEKNGIPEFETSVDINIEAYIPEDYIADEVKRLDFYKRISEITSEEGAAELRDELTDIYGEPPSEVTVLLDIALLKAFAHRAYVTELIIRDGSITMRMFPQADIDTTLIPGLIKRFGGRLRFVTGASPMFLYKEEGVVRGDVPTLMKKSAEIVAEFLKNA